MVVEQSRILDEVTKTSISLLLKEPFYSHFFSCMNKEVVAVDSSIQTMGVGLRAKSHTLFVNPTFWDEFLVKPAHRYGVVKHEVLHIVLKHTLADRKGKDAHLMNIAMDIVVNQYIDRENLPDESVRMDLFPELNLEKDQTWQYYYDKLTDLNEKLESEYKGTIAAESLKSIERSSHGLDRHEVWKEIIAQSKVEKDLLEAHVENLIHISNQRTSSKSYGKLPAGLRSYLDSILIKEKPLVDWRKVIKLFSESSSRTKIKNTIKRPSKRFGTVPGIKVRKLKKLLVAVDTSGSVSQEDLGDFFSEIYHIWRQRAEIQVVECDVKIQNVYEYRGKTPEFIMGRGGTDFNAPIEYGNKVFQPDGLIYFTDGYAPAPTHMSRFPILWVISRDGLGPKSSEFSAFKGRKAKLK
ncbi:VWA-like domain-containing protein [Flammeovirgaceae bacterium SG7u.111]|nr:VWA-like domain-containing protein [Flammeovirgaceae bacterium SG7u.132]WPO36024.1 VWA-like domain-containing protein [Flammeovirgaceae bacterium SG7u.111]